MRTKIQFMETNIFLKSYKMSLKYLFSKKLVEYKVGTWNILRTMTLTYKIIKERLIL